MINDQHNFIFIHIPKCAGTSIEYALNGDDCAKPKSLSDFIEIYWDDDNKIWTQHATAQQIKELYCENYEDYFSFTFVRNPWDRAVSDYFWIKKELQIKDSLKDYLLLEKNFNTPHLRYPHLSMHGRGDHILAQSDFIFNSSGELMVDFIGKFENLQEDFDIISNKIGISQKELSHENKGKHKHYTEYYNNETRAIVEEKYAKDIEYFGYKFGE